MATTDLKHLSWRCRRGMLELDVMLKRFLNNEFERLSPEQKKNFQTLLEQEDDVLWDWLSGRLRPQEQGCMDVVNKIRNQD